MNRLFPLTRPTEEESPLVPLSPQGNFFFFTLVVVTSIPAIVGIYFAVSWLWLFINR